MKPLDDKRFQIRLKKRFRQMTYALGATNCFMMPERMAKTPAIEQIKEYIGSGPFIFKQDEWVSGAKAVYVKNAGYVPRQEKPEYFSGGKVVNFERVEWIVEPDPATAAAALQTGEVDWLEFPVLDLLPMLRKVDGLRRRALRPAWRARDHRVQPPVPAIRQSETAARAAAGDRPEGLRHRLGRRAAGPGHVSCRLLHRSCADGE